MAERDWTADGRRPRDPTMPCGTAAGDGLLSRRDGLKLGIAALASLGMGEVISLRLGETLAADDRIERNFRPGERSRPKVPIDYSQARRVTGVCLNCSTVCGIVGHVLDAAWLPAIIAVPRWGLRLFAVLLPLAPTGCGSRQVDHSVSGESAAAGMSDARTTAPPNRAARHGSICGKASRRPGRVTARLRAVEAKRQGVAPVQVH